MNWLQSFFFIKSFCLAKPGGGQTNLNKETLEENKFLIRNNEGLFSTTNPRSTEGREGSGMIWMKICLSVISGSKCEVKLHTTLSLYLLISSILSVVTLGFYWLWPVADFRKYIAVCCRESSMLHSYIRLTRHVTYFWKNMYFVYLEQNNFWAIISLTINVVKHKKNP